MVAFVYAHHGVYGVEPIYAVLPIALSTYYEAKAREADLARAPVRVKRDRQLRTEIDRVWRTNRRVYGVRKVWKQLRREAIPVVRCTAEGLMQADGLRGVVCADGVSGRRSPIFWRITRGIWWRAPFTLSDRVSLGRGFYLRGDVARYALRRLRPRRLLTAHRGVAGGHVDAHRSRVGRARARGLRPGSRRGPRASYGTLEWVA